jgi:hypothetical protein
MLLWFLLQDELDPERWQSGVISAAGERKPSFDALRESVADLAGYQSCPRLRMACSWRNAWRS